MKRLTFISAALLSSALASPLMAQETTGGAEANPPILEQDQSGSTATQSDGSAAQATQEVLPAQPDGSQAGSAESTAGANSTTTTDDTAAGTSTTTTGQSESTAGASGTTSTEDTAAGTTTTTDGAASAETQTESTTEDTASGTQTDDVAPENQAADQNQADVSSETTASVNITEEQKTEIHQVIVESDVEPVDVDFDVSVGIAVPTTVTLAPLPPRVIEIVPQYEGYRYFVLADGRIIIVEPDTLEIVYILVV